MRNRIKELRSSKKISQGVLADYLGIAQNTLSYWENGKFDVDTESLRKLADYFECTIDYILYKDDQPKHQAFEGFTFEELVTVTKESDLYPVAQCLKNTSSDKYILFGLEQSRFINSCSKDGIFFNCWGPLSIYDLFEATAAIMSKDVSSEKYFCKTNFEVGFVKLPKSIISVCKNEGDWSYVILNESSYSPPQNFKDAEKMALGFIKPVSSNTHLHMLPQEPAQEPAKIVAFGGDNTTTEPNENYLERKALRQKIDEEQNNKE